MLPWSQVTEVELAAVRGVFTDIDDTLTTEGAITPDALQALHQLHAAGLPVIPITGRPISWAEPFAAQWPVPAIVAENGAVAWIKTGFFSQIGSLSACSQGLLLSKSYQQDSVTRADNHARLQVCLAEIEARVPGAVRATDSAGRETDIAIDHGEFNQLDPPKIHAVVRIMQAHGLNATVSSIHINGWIGEHNKLSGAKWITSQLTESESPTDPDRWIYVGDSTNDQVMFEAVPLSVGVANIARFASQLTHRPRYVTQRERGAGFAEVAAALLAVSKGR